MLLDTEVSPSFFSQVSATKPKHAKNKNPKEAHIIEVFQENRTTKFNQTCKIKHYDVDEIRMANRYKN